MLKKVTFVSWLRFFFMYAIVFYVKSQYWSYLIFGKISVLLLIKELLCVLGEILYDDVIKLQYQSSILLDKRVNSKIT